MHALLDWLADELLQPMAETKGGELLARVFCLVLVFAFGVVIGCNI